MRRHDLSLPNLRIFRPTTPKGEYLGRLVDLAINPSQNSFQVAYFFVMTPEKKLMCIAHEQISTISVRAVQTSVPAAGDQLFRSG